MFNKKIIINIKDVIQRRWFSDKLESLPNLTLTSEEKIHTYKLIAEAEVFDHFMQKKYPFVKRFKYTLCIKLIMIDMD